MIRVELDEYQRLIAEQYGIARAKAYTPQFNGITLKKNYDLEANGGNFEEFILKQIDAVGAESAVADYFGLTDFVPKNGTYKNRADVATNLEVKHTRLFFGNLIITVIDRDNDIAVLVTGSMPSYSIIGWKIVSECKQEQYKSERLAPNSYLVPHAKLKPMADLEMIGDTVYERVHTL